jgi:hypothetical protein
MSRPVVEGVGEPGEVLEVSVLLPAVCLEAFAGQVLAEFLKDAVPLVYCPKLVSDV